MHLYLPSFLIYYLTPSPFVKNKQMIVIFVPHDTPTIYPLASIRRLTAYTPTHPCPSSVNFKSVNPFLDPPFTHPYTPFSEPLHDAMPYSTSRQSTATEKMMSNRSTPFTIPSIMIWCQCMGIAGPGWIYWYMLWDGMWGRRGWHEKNKLGREMAVFWEGTQCQTGRGRDGDGDGISPSTKKISFIHHDGAEPFPPTPYRGVIPGRIWEKQGHQKLIHNL